MRTHLIPLAAALVLGASAGPAAAADPLPSAGKDIAYAIQLDGEGTYKYSDHVDQGGTNWYGHDVGLNFEYHGQIGDGVVFRNGSPFDTTADDLPNGFAAGGWQDTGSGPASPMCPSNGEEGVHGWMRLLDDVDINGGLDPLDGNVHLWLRPFERYDVGFTCGGENDSHPGVSLVLPSGSDENAFDEHGEIRFGHNPFDIDFQLPRDIIGMGYVEQLIPTTTIVGAACPGWIDDQTTECKLEWHATIKLTKLWEKAAPSSGGSTDAGQQAQQPQPPAPDDDLLVPLVPDKPTPPESDDDLLVPLVPQGKASLSKDGGKASFSVSCSAGCSGTATLTAGTGRGGVRAARAAKALARTRFTVPKGATRRVTLKLGAKARRAVRRAHGARIVVRTTSAGRRSTKTLVVRAPKRKAGR
ncbi:MAG TPA: hypothetical protein VFT50_12545 [Baekduia sp.]|nr:hypothetical protein [Baekduia sp.]